MPHIHRHPAPGFGELTRGWWVVPNNPFQVPVNKGRVTGTGELVAANWTLPQNPLANALSTVGLPSGERSRTATIQGLGAIDLTQTLSEWSNPGQWTLSQWAIVAGVGLLLLMTMRKDRTAFRAAKYRAKADYLQAISEARRRSPTLASRAVGRFSRPATAPQEG